MLYIICSQYWNKAIHHFYVSEIKIHFYVFETLELTDTITWPHRNQSFISISPKFTRYFEKYLMQLILFSTYSKFRKQWFNVYSCKIVKLITPGFNSTECGKKTNVCMKYSLRMKKKVIRLKKNYSYFLYLYMRLK